MRKLYENIEDIYIKGSPAELTSIITAMDISLQNISEWTEQLTAKLIKYSDSNKGSQFERVVSRLLELRPANKSQEEISKNIPAKKSMLTRATEQSKK